MSLKIRLARFGRTHTPFYRVVAIDSRNHREGKAKEVLGTYDPNLAEKNIKVDIDRVHYWVSHGAILSESVASLLKRDGYEVLPEEVKARSGKRRIKRREAVKTRAKKDGKKWVAPSRRAKLKHAAKIKAEAFAKLQEAHAAKKAAEEAAAAEAEAPAEESSDS